MTEIHAAEPVRLLRVPEVAAALGCSLSLAWRLVWSGEIRSVRIGHLRRVPADALREFLATAGSR
jgi:excisionase family DNA binding protein